MKKKNAMAWGMLLGMGVMISSCGIDMPKEVQTSFETMTVAKSDIELPYKFSARMKGQNDVTVTPQVGGQLIGSTGQSAGSLGSGELCEAGVRVKQESV